MTVTVGELAKELGFGEDIEAFKAWSDGDIPKYATGNAWVSPDLAYGLRQASKWWSNAHIGRDFSDNES